MLLWSSIEAKEDLHNEIGGSKRKETISVIPVYAVLAE